MIGEKPRKELGMVTLLGIAYLVCTLVLFEFIIRAPTMDGHG